MATISGLGVAAAAYAAGWRGNDLVTAVAIARAESSFDNQAEGPKLSCGQGARGLWQINMCVHKCANVVNIRANAQCAHQIYGSQGWKAWSTYTSGAYRQYLLTAQQAYSQLQAAMSGGRSAADIADTEALKGGESALQKDLIAPGIDEQITSIPGVREIGGFFSALVDPNTWLRVAEVGLGVLLIAVGLAKLLPTSALVNATPVGKIARSLT